MARLGSEQLSSKFSSFGIKHFEYRLKDGSGWVAFAHQNEFYFVRITSLDDLTTVQGLVDIAEARGEAAEQLVKELGVPGRQMPSIRDPVDVDNVELIRAQWAKDKAAGKWGKGQVHRPDRQKKIL